MAMKKYLLIAVGCLAFIGAGLGVYMVFVEPDRLVVRSFDLKSPNWPADFPPLTIAVLADLHAGSPHIDVAKIDAIVALTNELQPDLVLLAGDYVIQGVVGGRFIAPRIIAEHLAGLQPPLGTFAVLGNHDWWLDGLVVADAFEAVGIAVLENDVAAIDFAGQGIWLAGIADDSTSTPDVDGTLAKVGGAGPVVLFTHDPAVFEDVPQGPVLTVAGHMHGGQIYLPWLFAPVTPGRGPARWAYGHIHEGGRDLFVSGGIGTSILPIRLNMPPEIMVIRLEHGP